MAQDPRSFLNWDIIRSSMFVADAAYLDQELSFLRSNPEWATRWEPAVQEWSAGNPPPFRNLPTSSGTLIHHAYHVAKFEVATRLRVEQLDLVVEFGGGYGSMRRLLHNLGFRGTYIIHDLQPFTALQKYFLAAGGMDPNSTLFSTSLNDLGRTLDDRSDGGSSLLVGTWSVSEVPISLRESLVPLVQEFDSQLLAYQDSFAGNDNVAFFHNWQDHFQHLTWCVERISHVPGNQRYAFGSKTPE